ncbi:MAG: DUF2497 domain-containing protein [Alphaproteobacteria bacterium]|nr:DUF2497 domain-containing protein [Alphaproteobacteria bacterium]
MQSLYNSSKQDNSQASTILDKVTKALDSKKSHLIEEDDILELTDSISSYIDQDLDQPESEEEAPMAIESSNSNVIKMKEKMVSEMTAEKTSALFNQLKDTVKIKTESESLKFRSGTTMEEVVSELVRPHLVEWLNQNLPSIVKNCVEKEVKKLLPSDE